MTSARPSTDAQDPALGEVVVRLALLAHHDPERGRWSSRRIECAGVAQSVEHVLGMDGVTGSIPVSSLSAASARELKGAPPYRGGPSCHGQEQRPPLGGAAGRPEARVSGRRAPIPVSSSHDAHSNLRRTLHSVSCVLI